MSQTAGFYESVSDRITRGSARAILGLRGFRNPVLREFLTERFLQSPGDEAALLADPVFEAAFGWEPADCTLGDLQGKLLHGELIKALTHPAQKGLTEDYSFPLQRAPYRHQIESWQALSDSSPPRSVLVSSGTGSGKTECFLIPILNDLAEELAQKQDGSTDGVRAIFLYPLNALIKSQKERLQAWSEPFGGRIRFCLYNGDTPNDAKTDWRSEVPDRRTLRTNPPQMLVTNPTMLEYMLVRAEDQPILDKSQGRLRWIVIDEAHTYLGSQAAELTLLLRRTMHAFGCKPGEVHVLATSATIGGGDEAAKQRLRQFLSDLAGVPEDQVTVVTGSRERPKDMQGPAGKHSMPALEQFDTTDTESLYQQLSKTPAFLALRGFLVEKPRTLSELAQFAYGASDQDAKHKALALIDLCARGKSSEGTPFLPLRGHFFHRTLAGLWACANPSCEGRHETVLDDQAWPFGRIYFEKRDFCTCGSPVYELVQCQSCGTEYLAAEEQAQGGKDELIPVRAQADEDEFQEQLETPEPDQEPDSAPEAKPGIVASNPRLICSPSQGMAEVNLTETRALDWDGQHGVTVHLRLPDKDASGLSCGVCHEQQKSNALTGLFRAVRIGAPFLLTTTTPTLLSLLPAWRDKQVQRPLDGRRLVTFTDSRQGTARSVIKAQQKIERDYIGSLLYHKLATLEQGAADQAEIDTMAGQVEALREAVQNTPNLQPTLDSLEQQLAELEKPKPGVLGWDNAITTIQSAEDFKLWFKNDLNALTYSQLTDREAAELCLFREFFLRPKRPYSLEGLGLAQLVYPALEGVPAPAILKQRGVSDVEWVSLLRLSLDAFVRAGSPSVRITDGLRRWLGYPGKTTTLVAASEENKSPFQRYWPSARTPHAKRNRLVKLISHAFSLDIQDQEDRAVIDEILGLMWQTLIDTRVLSPAEAGYDLVLQESVSIQSVSEAWHCPLTRRLLPVSFRGITPYLPDLPADEALTVCQKVQMPKLEDPFWQQGKSRAADDWLDNNPEVQALRNAGAWDNISDNIARYSRYFRAVEHSAQLSGHDLTRRERDFKEGKINLLSCSTTMEMGVDIGGLSAVAMNNVPPHPANFLQRAGRAGRRGESTALSFTLCKATPHGEAVFRNPKWPFEAELATPRVDLRSIPIVQRHVNALALATYLLELGQGSVPKLRTGWFFESEQEGQSAPADEFRHWCETPGSWPDNFRKGVAWLIKGSRLEGIKAEELLQESAQVILDVKTRWSREISGLLTQFEAVKTRDGQSKPEIAIQMRLDRWRKEYLLGQLAGDGFLPGYGFPTGVVPLVTTTAEQIESARKSREDEPSREENRQRRAGFPTRDIAIAIRDYAPGTDTVLNGRVYRSSGVTLNWHLPPEAEGAPEIQDLRWIWRCKQCGSNGVRLAQPELCPGCGADSELLTLHRLLKPAGFAVDFRSRPHNDISTPQYVPVRDPLVSIEGSDWMMLPDPRLGRYRISTHGQLIHHSDGLHGQGYSLCLRCGRADSRTATAERPKSLQDHRRLQGGKLNDKEQMCPGNNEHWAIIDGLYLGGSYTTEVFELQLRDVKGIPVREKATAYTFGVALRRAFCAYVGIDEGEIGITVAEARDSDDTIIHSIYLFDTASGGAGYSGQIPGLLFQLIKGTKQALQCPNDCDAACQACLLTYETQFQVDQLNRHSALELLNSQFIAAFELPDELRAFGDNTSLELEPLPLAADREWQHWGFETLRLYLAGEAGLWEPSQWRLLENLRRFNKRGVDISLILEREALERLEGSQRDELAMIVFELGATVYELDKMPPSPEATQMRPVMEAGSTDRCMRWAVSESNALAPNSSWGVGDEGASFVRSKMLDNGLPEIASLKALELDDLRPPAEPGVAAITITRQLDGPVKGFGDRAWALVTKNVSGLQEKLQSDSPLALLRYTDRYLRSPLAVLLLERLIAGLEQYPGGLDKSSRVEVFTATLGKPHYNLPRLWFHDWQDRQDRDEVINSLLGHRFEQMNWKAAPLHELAHARLLSLEWEDGSCWQLRLDQGVGYWRASTQGNNHFPFQATSAHQAEALADARLVVNSVSNNFPTYWHVVKQ